MDRGEAIPPRTLCLGCDYDMTGLNLGPCPECGHCVGARDIAVSRARHVLTDDARGIWRRWLLRYGAAIAICGAVGGLISGSVLAAAWVLAGCAAVVGASVLAGLPWAWLSRPALRQLHVLIWVRCLWWLHLPWLCMPLWAAIVVAIAKFAVVSDVAVGLLAFALGLWGLFVLQCMTAWIIAWTNDMDRLAVRDGFRSTAAWFAMLTTLVAASVLGLLGGVQIMAALT